MNSRTTSPAKSEVPRVLLVDDEPKLRDSCAEGLRLENWTVVAAENGAEALRLVHAEPFDLMILDWMLPDCDGLEVLRLSRLHAPDLPVLMITARIGHWDQLTAFQHGATDYVTKPFAFADLVTRCRSLLISAQPSAHSP